LIEKPLTFTIDLAENYRNLDYSLNTDGSLLAVYGTNRVNNRGFFTILHTKNFTALTTKFHNETFINFDHLTWQNSSHFLITGSRKGGNQKYIIEANASGKLVFQKEIKCIKADAQCQIVGEFPLKTRRFVTVEGKTRMFGV